MVVGGCAGYIGSHLTHMLIADGSTVVGVGSLLLNRRFA